MKALYSKFSMNTGQEKKISIEKKMMKISLCALAKC